MNVATAILVALGAPRLAAELDSKSPADRIVAEHLGGASEALRIYRQAKNDVHSEAARIGLLASAEAAVRATRELGMEDRIASGRAASVRPLSR